MSFKIGDRVKHINRYGVGSQGIVGLVGTVVTQRGNHSVYGVEFDKHIEGHDCDGESRMGHGWNVCDDEIVHVEKSTVGKSFLEFNWPC